MKNFRNIAATMLMSIIATVNAYAAEAYARYDGETKTLTFFYNDQKQSTDYSMPQGTKNPAWLILSNAVEKVMFDYSFADYKPATTYAWFKGMAKLKAVQMLKNLNTEQVTTMAHMFDGCTSLGQGKYELSLAGWNTQNVTDMSYMFQGCKSVTSIDVTWFNTERVTTTAYMFAGCTGIQELNLANFKTANVKDMSGMFKGDTYLRKVYIITKNWQMGNVNNSTDMFRDAKNIKGADGTAYSAQFTDKTYARVDGNNRLPGYFHYTQGYAVYDENCMLTFYCDGKRKEHEDAGEIVYDLNTGDNAPAWKEDVVLGVFFDESFIDCRPMSCHEWFNGMADIDFIDGIELLNTSRATSMAGMFRGCAALTEINTSNFITDKVVDMTEMFQGCTSVTELDMKGFRTSDVKSFKGMFQDCAALTDINIGQFDITPKGMHPCYFASVLFIQDENIDNLFAGCENLKTLKMPSTLKGIKASMFKGCHNLQDIYYAGLQNLWITEEQELADANYAFMPNKKTRVHYGSGISKAKTDLDVNLSFVKHNDMTFEINSENDWNTMIAESIDGTALNVKLMADITVTEVPKLFVGKFDGNGHTITLKDKKQTEQKDRGKLVIGMPTIRPDIEAKMVKAARYAEHALFKELKDATVENLRVDGEFHIGKHGAGLAGIVNGTTVIRNCRVSAKLIFSGEANVKNNNYSEEGYVGGIVGHAKSSNLTIEGCMFDGRIEKDEVDKGRMLFAGAIVGWCNDTKNIKIKNCMECGTYETENILHCGLNYDKTRVANALDKCMTNTLHNKNWSEGKRGRKIYSYNGEMTIIPAGTLTTYNVSGITAGDNCFAIGDTLYAAVGSTANFICKNKSDGRVMSSIKEYDRSFLKHNGDVQQLNVEKRDYALTIPFMDVEMTFNLAKTAGTFDIEDETTGTQQVEATESTGKEKYYDLSGRLLNGKPQSGAYILNGKKYMK